MIRDKIAFSTARQYPRAKPKILVVGLSLKTPPSGREVGKITTAFTPARNLPSQCIFQRHNYHCFYDLATHAIATQGKSLRISNT